MSGYTFAYQHILFYLYLINWLNKTKIFMSGNFENYYLSSIICDLISRAFNYVVYYKI